MAKQPIKSFISIPLDGPSHPNQTCNCKHHHSHHHSHGHSHSHSHSHLHAHTSKHILTAFLMNLIFAIIEFIGGMFTGSIAIASDAIHDFGDAISLGVAYFLEKKSNGKSNNKYSLGKGRLSVLAACITNCTLVISSLAVITASVIRLIQPRELNYDGIVLFAIIGLAVNIIAMFITRDKANVNEKAINLHMLEDALGWIVVLIGSIIMKLTSLTWIDSVMSIGVALFILWHAIPGMIEVLNILLEKTPNNIDIEQIKQDIMAITSVKAVNSLHVWSIDGEEHYAVVSIKAPYSASESVREAIAQHNIAHVYVEISTPLIVIGHKEA